MTRFLLALALGLAIGGCSLVADDCLYDDVGCAIPGDWRLVSVNGEAATGRMEIAEGFVDRDTYAVLPTGNDQYPAMRGPASGDYSLDPDSPQRFDLDLWRMEVSGGAVYVDLAGRVEVDGDRMTYTVVGGEAEIIYSGGGSNPLDFPLLDRSGAVFVFER